MSQNHHNPQVGENCQVPNNSDFSFSGSEPSASLWNSPIGRRTFLKRTGGATVATALALHGFRVQVQAQVTGEKKQVIMSKGWVIRLYSTGVPNGWTTNPNGAGSFSENSAQIPPPAVGNLGAGDPPTGLGAVWGALPNVPNNPLTTMGESISGVVKNGYPKLNPDPPTPFFGTSPTTPGNIKMYYTLTIMMVWQYTD